MTQQSTNALVDPAWVAAHRDDPEVCLIEVAGLGQDELPAYRAGHVPGAYAWKWKQMLWEAPRRDFPSPQEFARRLGAAGIDNDTTVVFYGEGMQFGTYAWWVFRYCGHEKARVLDGARHRWAAEGRPLTSEVPPPRAPRNYQSRPRAERMRILRDDVLKSLGRPEVVLLDGRSPEEYRGERVGGPGSADVGAMCYGRIPGARHVYFEELLNADKTLKSPDELKRIFEARGAVPGKDVIAYCRLSHRATVLYLALTEVLGVDGVRVYDGSWTEWGNAVGLPVER